MLPLLLLLIVMIIMILIIILLIIMIMIMITIAIMILIILILTTTASFHNFKSQNFKLSVSNPKSKYVACLSVLSRISNCQGLGRKSKFEIMKTDRKQIQTPWVFITGGCSGRGVQWIGVVLYKKLVYKY